MVRTRFRNPGYHSKIPTGTIVHETRESLFYALALLQRDNDGDTERAVSIVRAVLPLQDTDPQSKTYGVWPWLKEEPLAEMSTPDLNWADFCAAQLLQMVIVHEHQLPPELVAEMRLSIGRAADAIVRRDVGSAYTNIAILGGGVCAAAGELLHDEQLLEYGRQRLQKVVKHAETHGSFAEYNSPPYTCVALAECERTLHLVKDPATREAAETLRQVAWKIIAESFHPGTQQWAGPHSRTSRDRLRPERVAFLSHRVGVELQTHPQMRNQKSSSGLGVVRPLECPLELAAKFVSPDPKGSAASRPQGLVPGTNVAVARPTAIEAAIMERGAANLAMNPRAAKPVVSVAPDNTSEIRRTFLRRNTEFESRIGTTWFASDACLGTMNRSTFWTQRKPVIGYWRTERDPAVVFRVRCLHNGKDCASFAAATAQNGPRALTAFYTVTNRGDWHRSLDRPNDGQFSAREFTVRFEVRGEDVHVESYNGKYLLKSR